MKPVITAMTTLSAAGAGNAALVESLRTGRTGLTRCELDGVEPDTWIGRVPEIENHVLTSALAKYDCRNHRLSDMCLESDGFSDKMAGAIRQYGADRIATIIGTSTSGIGECESAHARRDRNTGELPDDFPFLSTHALYSTTEFIVERFGLTGPAFTISTACSSSVKVFASAIRLMQAGLVDAALVGGVDSLCLTTLYGFNSLELVSSQPCRPFSANRDGISIGEAAGFMLLERAENAGDGIGVTVSGYGESSDAYHMSSPHPEGRGAATAIRAALHMAEVQPGQIDYINLHGTATPANDSMEDKAVFSIFGSGVPSSSTKGWTGHTLGAAGITEAVVSALAIQQQYAPENLNLDRLDTDIKSNILLKPLETPINAVLTNSFGFGGSNACMILEKSSG